MTGISRALQLLLLIFAALAAVSYASATVVGTSNIYAPAVILENNTGTITTISLTVTTGNGIVSVTGPSQVGRSTAFSAKEAAYAASAYLGRNESDYNFTYNISGAVNVSGPSGGLAMALLAVSALDRNGLPANFTVTGTISTNGSVGQIGGVYDKASAAHSNGLSFMLVPYAGDTGFESELYLIAQDYLGMPIVQISNISEAIRYLSKPSLLSGNATKYSFFTDYDLNVPQGGTSCSGQCTIKQFSGLANFTFNFTRNELDSLSSVRGMSGAQAQMSKVFNQSVAIAGKGYLYLGADLAFLDYINAFLFAHAGESVQSASSLLNSTTSYCNSLSAPNLTTTNYEYVLGGELRQQWGLYTLSSDAALFNSSTGIDSDQVSGIISGIAQATAWCSSAQYMYGAASGLGGNVTSVPGISRLAGSMVSQAQQYGGMYAITAKAAYDDMNYPLALLAASYAIVLSRPLPTNVTVQQLSGAALSMADNSTFGIWALQFSNEARFYAYQAGNATNDSISYATQAYQLAQLAQAMSDDYKIISSNFSAPIQPGFFTIDRGQGITLNITWQGGTPPYTVDWYTSSSQCSSGSGQLYKKYTVNGTSSSITVRPDNSTYYCATVTDSAYNPAVVASLSAFVSVNSQGMGGAIGSPGAFGQSLSQVIGMLELIIVVLIVAVVILLVTTIYLYNFKSSMMRKRRVAHKRRRR